MTMTDSSIKNVIVAGASGNLGAYIANELIKSKAFIVSVLTRTGSKAIFPPSVNVQETDYTYDSLVEIFKGQDAVVSAVNAAPPALQSQFVMVDACLAAGVKRFIPSEFGLDGENEKALRMVRILDGKAKLLATLREKEKEGLTWTAIMTGQFFDFGLATGFVGFDLKKKTALIYGDGSVRTANCNLDFVGRAVAAVLQRPEKTANKSIYVAQAYVTQNEMLSRLEQDSGEKYKVTYTTIEEQQRIGVEALEKGDFMTAIDPLCCSTGYEGCGSDFVGNGHVLANKELGLEEPDLDNCMPKAYQMVTEGANPPRGFANATEGK